MTALETKALKRLRAALSLRAPIDYDAAVSTIKEFFPAELSKVSDLHPERLAWVKAANIVAREYLARFDRCETPECGKRGVLGEPERIGLVTVRRRLCPKHRS